MQTWQPVPGNLMTRWAKTVSPENVWQEYPRPQMQRKDWLNLNGIWECEIVPKNQDYALKYTKEILVPFPIESALSGLKQALRPDERLWYRRQFNLTQAWLRRRVILHFGAVDWEAKLWLNGVEIGKHQGGYLPFSFDITEHVMEGANELVVSVWDPTDTYWQQHGKQVLKPKSIWYTAVSGIWQTVWLEALPEIYISGLKITPDIDTESVRIKLDVCNIPEFGSLPSRIRISVSDGDIPVAQVEADTSEKPLNLPISQPKLWCPDSPHLYDLSIDMGDDHLTSYFGMRKFSLGQDRHGRTRICLNNQPFFQYGPLDQGYWPDGLYTPPSDEAMLWELKTIKALGFNMLRKHVKVEPARYYYYCDKLGLIVWQDMMNGGAAVGDLTSFLAITFGSHRKDRNYHYAGRSNLTSRLDFRKELQALVDNLYNFTCIGLWVPFNEGWGQFDAKMIAEWLHEYDPSRLIDHASGWFDQGAGDCNSKHVYFKKLTLIDSKKTRAAVLSEFGGYSLKIREHIWDARTEFGYKKFDSGIALTHAYRDLVEKELIPLLTDGLSAAIYTQTTDVEFELNGYLTYDREVEKMDFQLLRNLHQKILDYQNT